MLDVFLLEQLDAFARTGTLSKAAEELHVTQPALSRNMKKLESLLGVSLFIRQGGRLLLTETGKVAAEYARRALDANQQVVEMTLAFDRSQRTMVLGSSSMLAVNDIVPLLQKRFSGKAITTELAENEQLLCGLHGRGYQLAILCEEPDDPGLAYQLLARERLCVSLPAGHPLARLHEIRFSDLADTSVIAAIHTGSLLQACMRHMPARNLVIQQNIEALEELLRSSSMPSFSSDWALSKGYAVEGRVAVPVMDDDASTTYYLACLKADLAHYQGLFDAVARMQLGPR